MVVGAARIFDAQGGVELVGGLAFADGSHVHGQQLGHLGRDAGRGAVADLFVVADQCGGGLGGLQPGVAAAP